MPPWEETLLKTVAGYRFVLRDLGYLRFTLAGMMVLVVYQQQYSSLAVYLKDVHSISPRVYGIMLAVAGLEIVLFQLWISRQTRKYPPFLMMVLGSLLFMAGFAMIGFVQRTGFFLVAVSTITIGEMVMFPTHKALAVNFSPQDMRGRYMAIYDLGWTIPSSLGPAAAGLILENLPPIYYGWWEACCVRVGQPVSMPCISGWGDRRCRALRGGLSQS